MKVRPLQVGLFFYPFLTVDSPRNKLWFPSIITTEIFYICSIIQLVTMFGIVIFILSIVVSIPIVFILVCTILEYRPDSEILLSSIEDGNENLPTSSSFRFLIWNIGYAGLNKEMDFFYDGGKMVRPSYPVVVRNLQAFQQFLSENGPFDFCMLQEVDVHSKRSYHINQREQLQNALSYKYAYLGINYNVLYVPMPLTDPMGHVEAGLLSLSNHQPYECKRISYPYSIKWPLRTFLLKRCFMPMRYHLSNGKDLIVINTHNSAFDEGGKLRIAELEYLKEYMLSEYNKGNYVVAGGDFNQSPVGLVKEFEGEIFDDKEYIAVSDTLFPKEWHFVFDNSCPSNRRTDVIYEKGRTRVALLDFFIASPNVKVERVKCHDLHFENTDHNPVEMVIRLVE